MLGLIVACSLRVHSYCIYIYIYIVLLDTLNPKWDIVVSEFILGNVCTDTNVYKKKSEDELNRNSSSVDNRYSEG